MKKSPGATNARRFREILADTAVQLATMLSSQENYSTVHGACIGVIFIPFFRRFAMNICCYGRKSIYSDHSDSIDNQFRMCRDYVEMKFSGQVDSFLEYQDEAFTGANT